MLTTVLVAALAILAVLALGVGAFAALGGAVLATALPAGDVVTLRARPFGLVIAIGGLIAFAVSLIFLIDLARLS